MQQQRENRSHGQTKITRDLVNDDGVNGSIKPSLVRRNNATLRGVYGPTSERLLLSLYIRRKRIRWGVARWFLPYNLPRLRSGGASVPLTGRHGRASKRFQSIIILTYSAIDNCGPFSRKRNASLITIAAPCRRRG
jgi:hypothetical protein